MDLDYLDKFIEIKKIKFRKSLQEKLKKEKEVNLTNEDLLFLILIYLRELLKRGQK
jgi:type III secretory pathway component EscR